MDSLAWDEDGWAVGSIAPLAVEEAWSLLSPEAEGRFDDAGWGHKASTFFRTRLALLTPKRYPAGTLPLADAAFMEVGDDGAFSVGVSRTRVLVITTPMDRAPAVRRAAVLGAQAIGGAGMDALIPRARRLWQVRVALPGEGDGRAPLLVAAVLAAALLAPVVPPGGGTIFGVKGARERLAREGVRT